jgi:hypothetical protein
MLKRLPKSKKGEHFLSFVPSTWLLVLGDQERLHLSCLSSEPIETQEGARPHPQTEEASICKCGFLSVGKKLCSSKQTNWTLPCLSRTGLFGSCMYSGPGRTWPSESCFQEVGERNVRHGTSRAWLEEESMVGSVQLCPACIPWMVRVYLSSSIVTDLKLCKNSRTSS